MTLRYRLGKPLKSNNGIYTTEAMVSSDRGFQVKINV